MGYVKLLRFKHTSTMCKNIDKLITKEKPK